jgi:hypothetical protein
MPLDLVGFIRVAATSAGTLTRRVTATSSSWG